jgi:diguanylate cyclase (GGDEF)-like protein/PAS domain S-box-containing protein
MAPWQADNHPKAAARQHAARLASLLLFGIALTSQLALMVNAVFGYGAVRPTAAAAMVTVTMFATAAGTLLSGLGGPDGKRRLPWLVLGGGLLSYAVGEAYFFFVQETITTFPTVADLFWLAAYPCIFAAIALLVREQREDHRLGISLDAAIIAIALGAAAYDFLFDSLVDANHVASVLGWQLSYSVLDLGIAIVLAILAIQSRGRVGGAYLAMFLGAVVLLATDFLNVNLLVDEARSPGNALDAGWSAGVLLLGLSCFPRSSLREVRALRGLPLYVTSVVSFGIALLLLLDEAHAGEGRDPGVMVFAALVPCLILIRFLLSVRENERLVRDNEGIIGAAGEGIFRTDLEGRITYANPAALGMLGYSLQEALGRCAHRLFHHTRPNGSPYPTSQCPTAKSLTNGATQRVTDELFWRKDGSSIAVHYTAAPMREGGRIVGAVTVFDDVTYLRQLREQLRHQADHDSLTGLVNRRRLEEDISSQLSYAERYLRPGVLVLIDVDSFKFVNDSFGHPIGDKLLCDIGTVLRGRVRETDVVARIGGDEFAVLLREADESGALKLAKGMIAGIREATDPTVGASVGMASFDGTGKRTPDELLVAADVALYEAKESGGGTAIAYSGQNGHALNWVERIRTALDDDRLIVYSQPIVDVRTGKAVREELLVRMLDDHGDKILPASFLPPAERFGLIHEIDLLVLTKAVELARRGRTVAVNVSALSLADPRYVCSLEEAVRSGLDPSLFNFEITETAAVANMGDAADFARRIRDLGCSLSLDDFGTGFSSFTYLKHIPAQYLKIDIEFIHDLSRSPADQQLVRAIVAIAQGLGQKTIAEGVEDGETLALVRDLGVDYAQGYHVGKPAGASGLGLEDVRDRPLDRALERR